MQQNICSAVKDIETFALQSKQFMRAAEFETLTRNFEVENEILN